MRISTCQPWLAAGIWLGVLSTASAQERTGDETEQRTQEETVLQVSPEQLVEPPARPIGDFRLYGGGHLGFGGKLKADPDGPIGEVSDDLMTTIGIQAGIDFVLIKYFAVGGELRLGWFNTDDLDDAGTDRSLLVDLDLKPRGRYMLPTIPLEAYVALPIGLTIPSLASDFDADSDVGWNLGVLGGANWFFTDRIGVNLEAGALWHWFSTQGKGALSVDADNKLAQFAIFANVLYAM